MLMDLSKAFEMINHDHLIVKFHAYGFSNDNLFDIDQKLNINLVHGKSWVHEILRHAIFS